MGTLVLYHGNCIDGFTAAWVAWRHFGDKAEYVPLQYGSGGADVEVPDVTGRDVIMVDFCTGREQLLRLHAAAASFHVLDHHKTAEAACAGLDFCTFDMNKSGAMLAQDYFCRIPNWLVSYVQDRDLWRFHLPNSKEINAYISAQPQSFERWSEMHENGEAVAAIGGRGVLAFIDRYVGEMCDQARAQEFAGYVVPVVNAPYINTSELVGKLAETALFAVGWFQRGDGKYQYSLRSRGDFDVSEIAKRYGGGGHKNAAGFAVDERVVP